jgi:hypothetical protein
MARALVAGVTLALVLIGALVAWPPTSALACSAGPDSNPAAESEVIVVGRATGLRPLLGGSVDPRTAGFVSFEVTIDVDRYLKGSGATKLLVKDLRSAMIGPRVATHSGDLGRVNLEALTVEQMDLRWGGDGCSALRADPRNQYFVAGLYEHDGALLMHRLLIFGRGSSPNDPAVQSGIARVGRLLQAAPDAPQPPHTGGAGLVRRSNGAATSVALAAVLVATARALTMRRPRGLTK